MVLMMARPWKDKKTGKFHLRQRTPSDLSRLRGTFVSLPLGDAIPLAFQHQLTLELGERSEHREDELALGALRVGGLALEVENTQGGLGGRM